MLFCNGNHKRLVLRGNDMTNEQMAERRVAREILSIIEAICFSEEYRAYRISYGSNGQRDLIISTIKAKYSVG